MPEIRKRYDREFREGAVRIVEETGKPIAQVARDLGWRRHARSRPRRAEDMHAGAMGVKAEGGPPGPEGLRSDRSAARSSRTRRSANSTCAAAGWARPSAPSGRASGPQLASSPGSGRRRPPGRLCLRQGWRRQAGHRATAGGNRANTAISLRSVRGPKAVGMRVASAVTPARRPASPLAEGDRRSPMGPTTIQTSHPLPADRS
jgi:transposase-like protein